MSEMTDTHHILHRRRFLTAGGLGLGIAALGAACVETRESEQLTQTGSRVPAPSTSAPPFPGTAALDARLVLTLLSVERLAVDTIGNVLKEGWLVTATTAQLARLIEDHHRQHATTLAGLASDLGQDAARVTANADVKSELVDNALDAVREATSSGSREVETAKVLASVEEELAQLYARATGLVTTTSLRSSLGSIGSATARQHTALAAPAQLPAVPLAFVSTAPAAIPEDSYVAADEARIPAQPATSAPGTTRR